VDFKTDYSLAHSLWFCNRKKQKTKKKKGFRSPESPSAELAAAAAKENDERYDNDPGAVIIKKMAKTVVIHNVILHVFAGFCPTLSYYARMTKVFYFLFDYLASKSEITKAGTFLFMKAL
jgi:hypothetical protein